MEEREYGCVSGCVGESERERERVFVCVCEVERERECVGEREIDFWHFINKGQETT